MKILMLNAPSEHTVIEYPDEEGQGFVESEDFGHFPPLGLLYVLSHLEKNTVGHEFFFKDCVAEKISQVALREIIRDIQPDVVGITSFTISLYDICTTARMVREEVPHAHLCLGGHHAIAFPYEAAKLKEFDSVVVGEGEYAFTDLINKLEKGEDITTIQGVYTSESIEEAKKKKEKDKRFLGHVTYEPAYIDDVNKLPFPDRKYISHITYKSTVGVTGKLATMITSRGCPYRCTFCDVPFKIYRNRDVEQVVDEIEECLKMGYEEFHFYDDLFNINTKKVIEFCDAIERRNLPPFHWDFRGRVNTCTYEMLEKAKKTGLRLISFGVETGSNEGLKRLKKGTTVERAIQTFEWCRQLGIKTVADYMIGLPHEKSSDDVMGNIDTLIELDPDYMQLAILTLYPNTPIYDEAVERGMVDPQRWKDFALNPVKEFVVDHWEEFLTTQEMVNLRKKAIRKFYFRPGYILKSVFKTKSMYEFKTKVKGALTLVSG